MVNVTFRKLSIKEAADVFALVIARVDWMNAQGLQSWNTTNYLERYPISYYEQKAAEGMLYGLIGENNNILSAGVLLHNDDRWPDNVKAIYIHNFVSAMTEPGAGSIFLKQTEQLAYEHGIKLLRLDVAEENAVMNTYYESRGFYECGTCSDGPYHGILREKKLM